jgi:hypothetical protein
MWLVVVLLAAIAVAMVTVSVPFPLEGASAMYIREEPCQAPMCGRGFG